MPIIDLEKFLDIKYLFDSRPPAGQFVIPMAVFFALCLVAGIGLSVFWRTRDQVRKVLRDKVTTLVWTCAIIGGMLTFFRWQRIPVFSSRVLLGAFFIVLVFWTLAVVVWRLRVYPAEMRYQSRQKTYQKYLPKKKNK